MNTFFFFNENPPRLIKTILAEEMAETEYCLLFKYKYQIMDLHKPHREYSFTPVLPELRKKRH